MFSTGSFYFTKSDPTSNHTPSDDPQKSMLQTRPSMDQSLNGQMDHGDGQEASKALGSVQDKSRASGYHLFLTRYLDVFPGFSEDSTDLN